MAYLPSTSLSRFTLSPTRIEPRFVSAAVVGITSTCSQSSPSPLTVSDTPFTAIDPFSTLAAAIARGHEILSAKSRPFGILAATVPRPSTWPCTTCPPKRSPARMARSRLTRAPGRSSARPVRDSVSPRTSAVNRVRSQSTTVRHTPFTATLSPFTSGSGQGSNANSRTSPFPRETRFTRPIFCISPVNMVWWFGGLVV